MSIADFSLNHTSTADCRASLCRVQWPLRPCPCSTASRPPRCICDSRLRRHSWFLIGPASFPFQGWTLGAAAEPEERVTFQIAIKQVSDRSRSMISWLLRFTVVWLVLLQRNLDILEKTFWEVSDPKHKNYQNFQTPEEV